MQANNNTRYHGIWIVTNTKFTSEAIRYASCVGIDYLDGHILRKKIFLL